MREMAPTGLLEKLMVILLIYGTLSKGENPCTKCYHPIYDGEDLRSLFRVHTNINPSCFNHSQLITCQEDGKVYWTTRNTASYRQRLLGECPIGEAWFCFENEGLKDIVKEKQLMWKKDDPDIPLGKNLFIDLVERISKELNLTSCWICGSTQMTEIWPWEGIGLSPLEILRWKQTKPKYELLASRGREKWDLKSKIIGEECILRIGKRYNTPVGKMACKRYLLIKNLEAKWVPREPLTYWAIGKTEKGCIYHEGYNLHKCTEKGVNPFWGIREVSKFWEFPTEVRDGFWQVPEYLFWICGDTAYTRLPGDWARSCTIGVIKPAFFLLPKKSGAHLGVPVYDDLRKEERKKRDLIDMGGTQTWKSKVCTPDEIIRTYGPATWAQDGSWGYRTPIYMLNRIIRLQAVLEKVSNRTALVFEHISDQLSQTRTVIYQIRLAVDYLLADEGGICGKFNSSKCCLEIDDKSEVIKNISKEIRKLAYVGNQEWTPLIDSDWWDEFWSFKGKWWKKAAFITICAITGLLFLPCLFPCLVRILTSTVQASIQLPEAANKKQTRIMVMESQDQKHADAKEIYNQYKRLRKFYFQEPETAN
ncbi:endogenous retrovirus group 3 member 1 Env polyprotein-like [Vidua chalybeata]|uniref:endogenous retrovirus group 3 member 1 Env polyprotein-like n=1 Tax=Vidua chalybeata TaxID=81927 RepID=UPI0023A87B2E|nr:endogenous retrovirus group 3 member 1 Env polyprotein-like [Vidua chalybeata]